MTNELLILASKVNRVKPRNQDTENFLDTVISLAQKSITEKVNKVRVLELQLQFKYGMNFLDNAHFYMSEIAKLNTDQEGSHELEHDLFLMRYTVEFTGSDSYASDFIIDESETVIEVQDIEIYELNQWNEVQDSFPIRAKVINQINKLL